VELLAVTLPVCLITVGVEALVNVTVAGATAWAPPPAPWTLLVHPVLTVVPKIATHTIAGVAMGGSWEVAA